MPREHIKMSKIGRYYMNTATKRTDRRIIRTKKAIRNAFAELLSEKNINQITIKDIADKADINRKTFYNYYSGIHQIVDEIENEIVCTFEATLKDINVNEDIKNPYVIFSKLTTIINSDLDFYGYLVKTDSNSNLISKIVVSLKEKIKESILTQIETDEVKINLIADFIISGMLAVYQNWFNSNRSIAIEKISDDVSMLVFHGINGLLKL